jgi:hypothetical protein
MQRRVALLGAGVAALALLAGPTAAANAAIPQDYHSGQCHVDLNLDSHKVVLDNNGGKAVTGTLANPNACPLDLPTLGYALRLRSDEHRWDVGSGVDQYGNVEFDFTNNNLTNDQVQPVGVLTPQVADFDYIDNDQNGYSIDAQHGVIIIDNADAQKVDVRYASRTNLTASRSVVVRKHNGRKIHVPTKTVSLKVSSTRFHFSNPYAPDVWGTAYQPKVSVQKYTKGAWHTIKTVKANRDGVVKLQDKSAKGTQYRAVSQSLWYVWPSTSKSVKR